ncbi:MAG: family 16 glycoside hydrolase, partial [Flavobacteriaceae bacterium]
MRKIILSIAILSIWSCAESSKNKSSEWINLFDGSSLEGWRAYNGDQMPPGWKIVDGILTFTTAQILE